MQAALLGIVAQLGPPPLELLLPLLLLLLPPPELLLLPEELMPLPPELLPLKVGLPLPLPVPHPAKAWMQIGGIAEQVGKNPSKQSSVFPTVALHEGP
jgi:hypothetical protein